MFLSRTNIFYFSALQIHIVNYNEKYANISEAISKPGGLAVLGILVEVRHKRQHRIYTMQARGFVRLTYPRLSSSNSSRRWKCQSKSSLKMLVNSVFKLSSNKLGRSKQNLEPFVLSSKHYANASGTVSNSQASQLSKWNILVPVRTSFGLRRRGGKTYNVST